ncbi:hypothetical protein PF003_g26472 [Phytophthora fragariae]|uniref:Uncharacterized protein n=1 Tax=Phytophthora fragariae TaxID=53985 RepID=A0A6A3DJ30_9STRA|nr:hypothetical protein PF003_g26472 [Phytophthora fragariae]KAE8919021.1 hypothetical protein PF009_g30665 [Phytophthora fragariae]
MSPSLPRVRRAACVAASIGGVRLHGVASATNIESASWTSASNTTNSSYYVEMSPSPPRVRRAACVAAVIGGVCLHAVASATNIESASWTSASNTTNLMYYDEMSPSPPRVRRAACVDAVMGGVSLHAVASATNIESASWTSASSTTNLLYYIEMSPSPTRVRRAACVAAVIGGVCLYGVASATNIESASWTSASTGTNSSYYIKMTSSPSVRPPCCLRRHNSGRSESPRRDSATNVESVSWISASTGTNSSYYIEMSPTVSAALLASPP